MFFYVIHNYIFTKSKTDESKYIKTLVCGSLLYIITHAFINDKDNQLYPYINYIFTIILLDLLSFSIKEKFINMKFINKIKAAIPKLKKEEKFKNKKIKKNIDTGVFLRSDNDDDDDDDGDDDKYEDENEIITDSLFQSEFNLKDKININSELIEYSEESSVKSESVNTESIELNFDKNLIST